MTNLFDQPNCFSKLANFKLAKLELTKKFTKNPEPKLENLETVRKISARFLSHN